MPLSVPEARPSARIATQVMRARAGAASAVLVVPPRKRPLLASNLQRNADCFQRGGKGKRRTLAHPPSHLQGAEGYLPRISTATRATPCAVMPMTLAAALERSMIRPAT